MFAEDQRRKGRSKLLPRVTKDCDETVNDDKPTPNLLWRHRFFTRSSDSSAIKDYDR